ncbi:unnamed protein product [Heterobilharzia americana]|nr:unnamed protein product [Heterobilharzia americana]
MGCRYMLTTLTPRGSRRLIVVINDSLMDNHQEELALTLLQGKHALVCTPASLNRLVWTGVQPTYPSHFAHNGDLPLPELQKLLGPEIPPEQAGFVGFTRGKPEKLLLYLEERLSTFSW